MSLLGILDTTVAIYRSADSSDAYGDTSALVLVHGSADVTFTDPLRLSQDDRGPGGNLTGFMHLHADIDTDIQQGDVLKYIEGTVPPSLVWEVIGVYRPRMKLLECKMRPWNGKVPT